MHFRVLASVRTHIRANVLIDTIIIHTYTHTHPPYDHLSNGASGLIGYDYTIIIQTYAHARTLPTIHLRIVIQMCAHKTDTLTTCFFEGASFGECGRLPAGEAEELCGAE